MASVAHDWTVADLLEQFGAIPVSRLRLNPAPGTATTQDVIDLEVRENRLFELIDGVLVEKAVGFYESYLASLVARLLGNSVTEHDLGVVAGADGPVELMPDQVRIPDVSFVSWRRLPHRKLPTQAIPQLVPNLAVEVISNANTREEMDRKLREYFQAGVQLVWYIDPKSRTVRVYDAPDNVTELTGDAILDGGSVLDGFELSLAELFAEPHSSDN